MFLGCDGEVQSGGLMNDGTPESVMATWDWGKWFCDVPGTGEVWVIEEPGFVEGFKDIKTEMTIISGWENGGRKAWSMGWLIIGG